MDGMEIIFENRIILISLVAVILPQAIALLLIIIPQIVKFVHYLRNRKPRERDLMVFAEADAESRVDLNKLGVGIKEDDESEDEPEDDELKGLIENAAASANQSANAEVDLSSDTEIQSLLADVFVDNSLDEKRDLLIGDMKVMTAAQLADVAKKISNQLDQLQD